MRSFHSVLLALGVGQVICFTALTSGNRPSSSFVECRSKKSIGCAAYKRHGHALSMAPNSNDDENDTAASPSNSMEPTSSSTPMQQVYQPVLKVLRAIRDFFNAIKWYIVTFSVGGVLAVVALIVPLYNSFESLSQPVTLFETILSDLDASYVEPVDSYKLFETGVTAMLNSLDPYTEFENMQDAELMSESIEGRYGGVGLVISGLNEKQKETENKNKGIRVVTAFEGYAFDYGMRVGDKLLAVDDTQITDSTTVEMVRNTLRGEPGTSVTISFERDGVEGQQSVTIPRSVVQLRDVKLATLLGKPSDGMGYIQLSGFASDAGREMRNAITYLQRASEDASHGQRGLQGLVIDLRGNPGGLLTSAVDVASLLVPKGSDIVSARGRGFPGVIYRSRVDPILDTSQTKLAVLVNGNTASAAEIVSGAVQDLDVGIIVGSDRTFGKGLVQNVEELPYNTALKFTVAKYYTPSGRCIQGINYKEGSKSENEGRFIASNVEEKDRGEFHTRLGRTVRDGGGIEADFKVDASKASPLEVILLRSGVMNDFAAEWSKKNELTNKFEVTDDTYKSFQNFVNEKQKKGDLQLEALYGKPLQDLKKALAASGYKGSEKSVEQLQARIVRDIQNDFEKYRSDIKEDISQSILARYLPESMLIERGVQKDPQVQAAMQLLSQRNQYDTLLAKGRNADLLQTPAASTLNMAKSEDESLESVQTSVER